MPLAAARSALLAVKNAIKGILVGPNQVGTSYTPYPTATFSQRKIDRCSNGVLWFVRRMQGTLNDGQNTAVGQPFYSTDNGATWTAASNILNNSGSSSANFVTDPAFFIDKDDYAHVVFRDNGTGYIFYRRGTPNAGRTSWTWSGTTTLFNTHGDGRYPDIVAHKEGTGWRAHVVFSRPYDNPSDVSYVRIDIDNAGNVTSYAPVTIAGSGGGDMQHKYPSIDFNHTGDCKTVKDGTPHLYVSWSQPGTGATKGIRFNKGTYSAGAWTWGTDIEVDQSTYLWSNYTWLNCLFDGTAIILSALTWDPSGSQYCIRVWEINPSTLGITTRVFVNNPTAADILMAGSASFDADRNVYLIGRSNDGSDSLRKIQYRRWKRSSATLESPVVFETTGLDAPHITAKRGYSKNCIEFVYTDVGNNVKYGGIK